MLQHQSLRARSVALLQNVQRRTWLEREKPENRCPTVRTLVSVAGPGIENTPHGIASRTSVNQYPRRQCQGAEPDQGTETGEKHTRCLISLPCQSILLCSLMAALLHLNDTRTYLYPPHSSGQMCLYDCSQHTPGLQKKAAMVCTCSLTFRLDLPQRKESQFFDTDSLFQGHAVAVQPSPPSARQAGGKKKM